jgi:hypothetical protein
MLKQLSLLLFIREKFMGLNRLMLLTEIFDNEVKVKGQVEDFRCPTSIGFPLGAAPVLVTCSQR